MYNCLIRCLRFNCIDISQLKDTENLNQTAMFSACVIKDPVQSLAMVKALAEAGVDSKQVDTINQ